MLVGGKPWQTGRGPGCGARRHNPGATLALHGHAGRGEQPRAARWHGVHNMGGCAARGPHPCRAG